MFQGGAVLAIAAMIVTAILHTYSRMGYLSSLLALSVCGVMSFSNIGVALVFVADELFIARFSNLGADARFQIWPEVIQLIKSFPLFGCSLGGFESGFIRYQTVLPRYTIDYAHNDYLQILAGFGFVALLP